MVNELENKLKKYRAAKKDRELDFSRHSHARLGLGHTGGHLKCAAWLDLQADFSRAKDAVFSPFDSMQCMALSNELKMPCLNVKSQANEITPFLLKPDLGRLLDHESENILKDYITHNRHSVGRDILIVISGGLSPTAIQHQIQGFLPLFIDEIRHHNWSLAPLIINEKGRVALGDQINHYFKAKITAMLIGERPGLSTFDSMGIYCTYDAKPGCTDEQRNCISNIHGRGLSYEEAVSQLIALIQQSLTMRLSGMELKEIENKK